MTRKLWLAIGIAAVIASAVVAFVAYGGISPGGTPRQQLQRWVTDTQVGQSIGTLTADGRNVGKVVSLHRGTLAVHTACGVLTTDAEAANSHLPSPNTEITQLLARAYTLEYRAGTDCYNAGQSNTSLLARSAAERAQAEAIFTQVLQRLATLTGHAVPTTTTTQPTAGTGIFG